VRAVLLDAGLTLLRADPSLGGVYSRVTRAHGREVREADFERAAEAAFHAQAADHRAAGEEGLRTSDDHERVSWRQHARRVVDAIPAMAGVDFDRWFEDLYGDFGSARAWAPYDDAVPAVEALRRRGLRLAVVSNWDSRLTRILEEHGLRTRFDTVVISAEVGWRKPHPAIFRRTLEALGVAPGEVLHVGDSVGDDVEGARAAGVRPVLLDRAGTKRIEGCAVIRGLGELAGLVGG
jgi:putative hydrolase of the HAD superfamily